MRCSFVVARIMLTTGELGEVTATDWTMGLDYRLKCEFGFVSTLLEPANRPETYTMRVRFFSSLEGGVDEV